MKKKRFNNKLLTIIIAIGFISFNYSCQKEDISEIKNNDSELIELSEKNDSMSATLIESSERIDSKRAMYTNCDINGPSEAIANDREVYTYTSNEPMDNVTWTVVEGRMGIVKTISNTVIIRFLKGFDGGTLRADGDGNVDCDDIKYIRKRIVPDPICSCPAPVIHPYLCASGGHPHWRFTVENINAGDEIKWSIYSGTIHGSSTSEYVIIEPDEGSLHGFTVYCKIVRRCPNAKPSTRTAYYSNYYGGKCNPDQGTKGFINSCQVVVDG